MMTTGPDDTETLRQMFLEVYSSLSPEDAEEALRAAQEWVAELWAVADAKDAGEWHPSSFYGHHTSQSARELAALYAVEVQVGRQVLAAIALVGG